MSVSPVTHSPAADDPFPEVYTDRGAMFWVYERSCELCETIPFET